jgi:hypothetical protein
MIVSHSSKTALPVNRMVHFGEAFSRSGQFSENFNFELVWLDLYTNSLSTFTTGA